MACARGYEGEVKLNRVSLRTALLGSLLLVLSACAPQAQRIATASAAVREKPLWAFQDSDIPLDSGYRFGVLANGMRFVVRQNATPKGTAIVRMEVAAGSLDENESELGYAHFVEHMAFNGSTRVPEGEMVRLLERDGLAFGADTNASTSFERTTYKLDLPRNDPALLDTALMLMRETASELTFDPQAVERERGVVLSEMRDRNTWALRETMDDMAFQNPGAHYTRRLPIGTAEALNAATADSLKAFWAREYVPAQTSVVVIGDFDPVLVEAKIAQHLASWSPSPAETRPDAGPVDFADSGRTGIYIDQALSNRVTAMRHGPWLDEPDTIAQRQENLLRQIGYAIVNRRLERLSNRADPPFRGAGFGTGEIFHAGRTTRLIVDVIENKWQRGLHAGALEYRRAMRFGFSKAEVAEQVAAIRASARNAAGSADTRSNRTLEAAVFALLRDSIVPSHPQGVLDRLEAFVPSITPRRVLAALRREAVPLADPLLRFRGRKAPDGGAQAIRAAWDAAMREPIARGQKALSSAFAYTDFGPPGTVASDSREASLGIRTLRFANGVMLNLKRTEIERDRVLVQVSLDGGERLNTWENPLATEMVKVLRMAGLGKHSSDELRSILAGRTVQNDVSTGSEAFSWFARTTPADLELQLQLIAAYITDPGYRIEGQVQYLHNINNYFAQLGSTPSSALTASLGGILSDDDPRFTLQKVGDYRRLTLAKLKQDLSDRLAHGAIEIAITGDIDEEQAIALVTRSFGALPAREPAFLGMQGQSPRPFTQLRSQRVLRHSGPADQALLRLVWPTRDDSDWRETAGLDLLERVVRIELTETLREKLGEAYSPGAASMPSRSWKGYGTFSITSGLDVSQVGAARKAIAETLARLRDAPVGEDLLQRARQPLLEAHDNALKSNSGWMALIARTQGRAGDIARHLAERGLLMALRPEDIQALARRYLDMKDAVEVLVLPEGVEPPAG